MSVLPNAAERGNPAVPIIAVKTLQQAIHCLPNPMPQMPQAVPPLPPLPPKPLPEDKRPVDLWGNFNPPPLPCGLVPYVIERFAISLSEQMGADAGGLAMSALTVCAAAIPDSVRLQVKEHDHRWKESARLWTVLVGLPSTKKSPIMSAATRPLAAIDAHLMRDWQGNWRQWDALEKAEKKVQPEPLQRRFRLGDTTVEAAQEVFKGTTNGLLVHADELSGWFGALDKYSGGKGASADRSFWLQAWNGGEYALNRVGRGAVLLDNVSASILGGIQPEAIARIAGDAVDDGLLQRFLPVMLQPSTIGQDTPVSGDAGFYDMAVQQLVRATSPTVLRFDRGAQVIRRSVEVLHHRSQVGEAVNNKLGAHIGKLDGMFARLCIVWHCVENCWGVIPPIINEHTADRVSRFMRSYLLPHAFAFYSSLGISDDHDTVQSVAGYILAQRLEHVDRRTISRGVRGCRKLDALATRKVFETLEALGWLSPWDNPEDRRVGARWVVNPEVHRLFSERAEQEFVRRLQARATIMELTGRKG